MGNTVRASSTILTATGGGGSTIINTTPAPVLVRLGNIKTVYVAGNTSLQMPVDAADVHAER